MADTAWSGDPRIPENLGSGCFEQRRIRRLQGGEQFIDTEGIAGSISFHGLVNSEEAFYMGAHDAWTGKEIATLIVATGVISAFASFVLSTGAEMVKHWLQRKRDARYGAMRCAVALERYAAECWHVSNMSEGHYQMTQDAYSSSVPSPPKLPDDIDWKVLDGNLANSIMSLVTTSKIEESQATYARAFEGNPFDFDTATKNLGLEALKIAARLRAKYDLSSSADHERLFKGLRSSVAG